MHWKVPAWTAGLEGDPVLQDADREPQAFLLRAAPPWPRGKATGLLGGLIAVRVPETMGQQPRPRQMV